MFTHIAVVRDLVDMQYKEYQEVWFRELLETGIFDTLGWTAPLSQYVVYEVLEGWWWHASMYRRLF